MTLLDGPPLSATSAGIWISIPSLQTRPPTVKLSHLPLAVLILPTAAAQSWIQEVPDFPWAVDAAANGDVLAFTGDGRVTRLDSQGDVVWTRLLTSSEALWPSGGLAAADGGFAVYGLYGDGFGLARFDADGNGQWGVIGEGDWEPYGQGAAATSGGGFVVVGNVLSGGTWQGGVLRVAADGTILQALKLVDDSGDFLARDVLELPDGSLLVAGRREDWTLRLSKIDATGSLLWTQSYDFIPADDAFLLTTPEGNAQLVTSAGALLLVDPDGSLLSAYQAPNFSIDVHSAVIGHQGELVLAGRDFGDDAILALTPQGSVSWGWKYAWPMYGGCLALTRTETGYAFGSMFASGSWPTISHTGLQGVLYGCQPDALLPAYQPKSPTVAFETGVHLVPMAASVVAVTTAADPVDFPSICLRSPGVTYCSPAEPNSSGQSATLLTFGSHRVADDDLALEASGMPAQQFGYFLAGTGSGEVLPPGSQGRLCLGGADIFRYAKDVASTGSGGAFSLDLELTAIPGHGPVLPGETWNFQAWFRDVNPNPTSNFTDAQSVSFE